MTYLTIEDNLKPFLQTQIVIRVGEKIIRQGKLILFNLKDYYIVLTIKIKGRNKMYEIPYPFTNAIEGNTLVFDYRLKHLHNNDPAFLKHNIFSVVKKSKYYDNIAVIESL